MSDWQTREIERLRRGLEAIRGLRNKTLLGDESYQLGASIAFSESAELAASVLDNPEAFSEEPGSRIPGEEESGSSKPLSPPFICTYCGVRLSRLKGARIADD